MTAHAHHDHHEVLHLARQVLESGLQLADGASDERLVGDLAVVAANGLQQRLARRALVHVAELETPPIDLVCRVTLQEMFHEQVRLLRLRQLLQVRCGGGGCVLRTRLVRTRILVLVRRLLQPSFDRLDLSLHRLLVQIIVQIIVHVREIFLLLAPSVSSTARAPAPSGPESPCRSGVPPGPRRAPRTAGPRPASPASATTSHHAASPTSNPREIEISSSLNSGVVRPSRRLSVSSLRLVRFPDPLAPEDLHALPVARRSPR